MTRHIHHIIPKHMGGSDHPSNLIELTVEEHAEAHRKLYEEHGNEYDHIAWRMLSGQIPVTEATRLAQVEGQRKRWTEEARQKASVSYSGQGNPRYGKTITDDHKAAISKANSIPKPWLSELYKGRVVNVMTGADNPRAQKVKAEGILFNTVKECQEYFGFKNHNTIRYRCNSDKYTNWEYV